MQFFLFISYSELADEFDEFMPVFCAATIFFVFFIDIQCFRKEDATENQEFRGFQQLIGKRKINFYTVCSLIHQSDVSSSVISYYQICGNFMENNPSACNRLQHPASYTLGWILYDICLASEIRFSGFMDLISRLPPPGGTIAADIVRTVVITSCHLSSRFIKEFHNFSPPSLRVDIVFDADYEKVLGENAVEFQNFLLCHLKHIFRRSQFDVHTLSVKRGSIGISFFINFLSYVKSKKLMNRCLYLHKDFFHEQEEKLHNKIISDGNCDEVAFLEFLKYMNYHLSSKPNKSPNEIPYSVKTSYLKSPTSGTRKLKVSSINSEKMDISKIKDLIFLQPSPTLQAVKENQQEMTSDALTEKFKSSVSGKEKKNLPLDYFEHRNLHLNRIRRYIARENEAIMKLKVEFKFEKAAKDANTDEFQRHLVSQLAKTMRVPIPSIQDMKITSDRKVSFTLSAYNDANNIMDDTSVVEAADLLKGKIRSQQIRITDLNNGQLLKTTGSVYASVDETSDYSLVVLIILCITLLMLSILIIIIIYVARRASLAPRSTSKRRKEVYRDVNFGRDSSQSIGKYSYDSGLWLGPGPALNFTVPEAPFYRPPTVEQIASTPRPETAVRTRLKRNWNVDERALSTIPDGTLEEMTSHKTFLQDNV